jgi:hypothetical protein
MFLRHQCLDENLHTFTDFPNLMINSTSAGKQKQQSHSFRKKTKSKYDSRIMVIMWKMKFSVSIGFPTILENVVKDLYTSLHSTLDRIKTFKQSRVDVIRLGDLIVEFDQRESQQLAVYVITKVLLLDFMITLEGPAPAAAYQLLENVQLLDSSKLISNDISEKKASLRRLRSSLTRQQESSWIWNMDPSLIIRVS